MARVSSKLPPSPFIELPLPLVEVALIHSLVGLVPPIVVDETPTCSVDENEFKPDVMEITLRTEDGSAMPRVPIMNRLMSGHFLVDSLHGSTLRIASTPHNTLRLLKIGTTKVNRSQKIYIDQKEMIVFNGNENFFDEDDHIIVRVFDENASGITYGMAKNANVFTDCVGSSAFFGPPIAVPKKRLVLPPVDGLLVIVPSNPTACREFTRQEVLQLSGAILLTRRGDCDFQTKVLHGQLAGAVAVVIISTDNVLFIMSASGDPRPITIPSVLISASSGREIVQRMIDGRQMLHALIIPQSLVDLNSPLNEQGRSILSLDNRVIENLVLVTSSEYERLLKPTEPAQNVMRRILLPGMGWNCLRQCRISLKPRCCAGH